MESIKNVFKFFWFPATILAATLCFAGYMAWKECKIKNNLVNEALQGNRTAIAILGKYEKPWKLDEKVVNEALKSNQYALQILGIDKALIEYPKNQPNS